MAFGHLSTTTPAECRTRCIQFHLSEYSQEGRCAHFRRNPQITNPYARSSTYLRVWFPTQSTIITMTLNVGIVGTGIFATHAHLPVIQGISNLTPYAAFNRTKAKAEVFAEKAGISKENVHDSVDELFQDPNVDFVDALLPVQSNLDAIKTAIKYNKPICLEKPVAANLEQAREIVKLAEASNLPIGILEQWAFLTAIDELKKIIPKLGEIVAFTYSATGPWNTDNKYAATPWRLNPEHIGGYLSDGGVHQLALLTEVLGEVESVSARTRQLRSTSGTDDILFSTLKMKSGAIGTFTYGSTFGASDKKSFFTIFGTDGSVTYDWSPSLEKPTIVYRVGSSAKETSGPVLVEFTEIVAVQEEFKNFAEAVEKKDKSIIKVGPAKAFHHLAIIGAALESSNADGASVKIESP